MKRLMALTLAMVIILVGCKSGGKDKTVDGGDNNPPQEYSTVYSGEITTINYLVTASTNEFALAANMVDTLIDYDKYGIVQPALANEWSTSDDGLVWTFKLRDDVNWVNHKGKKYAKLTAQDFVDSMNYILNPENESQTSNIIYGIIKNAEEYYNGEIKDFEQVGVKALDEHTLEYTIKQPTPYFLSMLNYVCFFPVNGKFLEEMGDRFGTDNETILYNGAYIMETFEPQNRRILVANKDYWDKENIFIGRINQTYNKESSTLSPELFIRGEIDYTDISSDIIDEWMKDPKKVEMVRPNRTTVYTYFFALNFDPQFDTEFEPDNWKKAVNNVNFRKSLFHGLDRIAAMTTAEPYNPEQKLSNTITPKSFVDLDGVDYTQLGKLKDFSNKDSFDTKLALEYKEKAMEELGGNVTFPVKVYMPYNSETPPDWGNRVQVIEQQLENLLGLDYIDVIIDAKPPTGFLSEVRRSGKYGLLEANWGPDYADPETYTDPFAPGGTYNWPEMAEGYEEANGKKRYENLLDAAKAEVMDVDKRYELFADAESFLIEEAFVIPYALGGGGYSASRLNPFESQYSPFGVSAERYKGQKIMDKPMNTEEYKIELERWEKERAEALKAVK